MSNIKVNKYCFLCIITICYIFFPVSGNATQYFVSTSGNDLNPGTSEDLPWKSLEKVNKVYKFEPGDQILFKRGDVWEGTLVINVSGAADNPVIYGAYGIGEKPVIYGSETITGWTKYSENIYQAKVVKNVSQIFYNGQMMMAARTPNSGCIFPDKVISKNQISSSSLNSTIDYKGANFISRTLRYRYYSETVTESDDEEITLSGNIQGNLSVNEGFILTNKLEFLDSPGEWYYDNNSKMVYFWPPSEELLDDNPVRATVYDHNIFIQGKKFIIIKDLHLSHSAYSSIYQTSSDYITYDNCQIDYPNVYGIRLSGDMQRNVTITNNTISNSSSDGIAISCNKAIISHNEISDIGLFSSIGNECPSTSTAIRVRGDSCSVLYNRIQNVAYNGISFAGANTEISYNYFNNTNQELDDGASIYTYQRDENDRSSSGSVIRNNIILNNVGSADHCFKSSYGIAYGIYLDKNSNNILVENNTVAHCQSAFTLGEATSNNIVRKNTFFDFTLGAWIGSTLPADGIVDSNIFYSINRLGSFIWWNNKKQRVIKLDRAFDLKADHNLYVNHYNENELFDSDTDGYFEPFSSWQLLTGQDLKSKCITSKLNFGETEKLFYNSTSSDIVFNIGILSYKDIEGNAITRNFKLTPFSSKILIGKSFDEIHPSQD